MVKIKKNIAWDLIYFAGNLRQPSQKNAVCVDEHDSTGVPLGPHVFFLCLQDNYSSSCEKCNLQTTSHINGCAFAMLSWLMLSFLFEQVFELLMSTAFPSILCKMLKY